MAGWHFHNINYAENVNSPLKLSRQENNKRPAIKFESI